MDLYVFKHNTDKINEEITMIHINGDSVTNKVVGNIYNLVDYINYNVNDNSKLKFINFTGNKLDFIIKATVRYRDITRVDEYYSLIVKDKRSKIRGR